MAFLAIGLLFKIGAVPFHNWVPDVYVGAPTPVTGFMAICTKLAAVGATVRVFFVAFGAERWAWQPLLAGVAVSYTHLDVYKRQLFPVADPGDVATTVRTGPLEGTKEAHA